MRLGSKSASSPLRFRSVCENTRNWLGRGLERRGRTLKERKGARWGELTVVNEAPARHDCGEAASNSRLNRGKTVLNKVIYERNALELANHLLTTMAIPVLYRLDIEL
jgi:hypothetical protein